MQDMMGEGMGNQMTPLSFIETFSNTYPVAPFYLFNR